MNTKVRVRFAPSPTGGLHLGGVRTVLYNYLFAKKLGGAFIVRIEDTDQTRFVEGAENYIFNCLEWCGLVPDESPLHGGSYGPYRQSERKAMYREYAEKLINDGHAYYAFDTPEELEQMRIDLKTEENPSPQYDGQIRMKMKNSLALDAEEVKRLIDSGARYVVRIKMPENKTISFTDMIHEEVSFESALVDDKVLLKADGMPTYHLAVVVDDYLMKITHAFRGEEWLSSAPVHILLWEYLFGLQNMPQWAHLPLILGPNGKLSKRDGAKFGFPVFAMNWTDPRTNELTEGFKEKGFLPEAFLNLLAVLGWNDGTEQEIFSMDELITQFSMDRVHKSGAKFDFEKAKWFNHEWIKKLEAERLAPLVKSHLALKGIHTADDVYLQKVIEMVKDRCTLIPDFLEQAGYFFKAPEVLDTEAVKPKWTEAKAEFFQSYCTLLQEMGNWDLSTIESSFKQLAAEKNIKPGELQLPFRIMLVGGKFGPAVFDIANLVGKDETVSRIKKALSIFNQ
ncbi:MAG TPA: glutamate--tRNA ligase [Ferruginibacter sp.]|nr:glutamate--tRNA ligase [Ferruginibacter sp.]